MIVPTRDRPNELAACVESFAALRYPSDRWELIVVNDGGRPCAAVAANPHGLPLRVLDRPHGGPAAARNAGAQEAVGDYLAFTDDDCVVEPDWLSAFARGFTEAQAGALGGGTLLPEPAWLGMRASQFVVDVVTAHQRDATGNPLLIVSNNAAYRRSVFESVGGFDERFPMAAAEDMEMGRRLARLGYRQQSWPAARVCHCHRLTSWGHVRQQFRYGRGGYHLRRMESSSERGLDRGFYSSMARALWCSSLPRGSGVLIAAAQVAYRAGVLRERLGRLM